MEKFIPRRYKSVKFRRIPENIILYRVDLGKFWFFNDSTEETWNLIDGVKTIQEISKILSQKYDVPEDTVLADLIDFFTQLARCELIEFVNVANEGLFEPMEYDNNTFLMYAINYLFPPSPLIELLYDCNLLCSHCYISDLIKNPLSTKEVIKLLGELKEMGTPKVTFSGGEIFLRKDILELCNVAEEEGFICGMITNGTLLTNEHFTQLEKINLSAVKLSLYGVTADVHEKITRVQGSFKKTLYAIEKLREIGKKVTINCILMKENFHQVQDLIELAAKLGCDYHFDHRIFSKHNKSKEPLEHFITPEQMVELMKMEIIPPSQNMKCLAGICRTKIAPDGSVYPCERINYSFGNIREQSLAQIFRGPKAVEFENQLENYNPPVCKTCEYDGECIKCPAIAWEYEMYSQEVDPEITCLETRLYHTMVKNKV